jgi:FMN phosphatase YigB (HAD superfamily)
MKIGWDSDGVLYRFTKAHYSWMNKHHGMQLDIESEPPIWDYFTEWGLSVQQFLDSMDAAVDAGHLFWTGELYEPTIPENIRALKAAGHTNHLVTHRFSGKTRCSKAATEHFYAEKGIEFDSIHYSRDKTVAETDIFIEDNLKNYDALEAAGIPTVLVNRPYNLENDSRIRVNSVDEFTKLILEGKWDSSASF